MLESISPFAAIAGGLLIGTAATLLLISTGRIAGVSGMIAAAAGMAGSRPSAPAAAFVLGLPLGALLVSLVAGPPELAVTSSVPLLIAGGLLVGFGTRLGNGCTSGHGVCGLSRLSARSLAATLTFMASGMLAAVAARLLGAGS